MTTLKQQQFDGVILISKKQSPTYIETGTINLKYPKKLWIGTTTKSQIDEIKAFEYKPLE